jgi:hypothetical protein
VEPKTLNVSNIGFSFSLLILDSVVLATTWNLLLIPIIPELPRLSYEISIALALLACLITKVRSFVLKKFSV